MYLPGSLAVALPLLTTRQLPNSAFLTYPSCAIICAEENSVESCYTAGASDSQLATCYCPLTDYQKAWAQCCYKACSPAEFNETASDHQYNCDINGSPSSVNKVEWIAYGEDSFPAVTASASTPTGSTSSQQSQSSSSSGSSSGNTNGSNNNNSDSNGTLSTAALIGTILGSVAGVTASCFGIWFGWKSYKDREKEKKEKRIKEERERAAEADAKDQESTGMFSYRDTEM